MTSQQSYTNILQGGDNGIYIKVEEKNDIIINSSKNMNKSIKNLKIY